MKTRTCKWCGEELRQKPAERTGEFRNRQFCNRSCAGHFARSGGVSEDACFGDRPKAGPINAAFALRVGDALVRLRRAEGCPAATIAEVTAEIRERHGSVVLAEARLRMETANAPTYR